MTQSIEPEAGTVVVLGSYAPSLIIFRGTLIEELVRRGYKVVAMAPDIGPDIAAKLRAIGAEPRRYVLSRGSLNPLAQVATLRSLVRAFREIRPRAVIGYTIQPATVGTIAAHRAGVPNIVALVTGIGYAFIEGKELKRRVSRLGAAWLYRRAFRRASLAIFQNSDDRDFFHEEHILPRTTPSLVVNGSGIDIDKFAVAPLSEEPVFIMVARLLRDKGVREYAAAALRLKARYPHASFRIAGWLDESHAAISQAELDAMIAGGIEFLGKLEDVRPAVAAANIFVHPSYREGTPRSVLEAMAMGRPIITTDAPGCRQTIEPGRNGLMIPPRDVDALEAAMERFILEPRLIAEMGAGARAVAEEKYDVHRVNEVMLEAAGL